MDPEVVVTQPGRQALHLVLESQLVLGRECEGLLLADAQVSRRHLELRPREGQVYCIDLGSTNGTFLDGERVTIPVVLAQGAVLALGDTTVRLADSPAMTSARKTTTSLSERVGGGELTRTSIDFVADMVAADEWQPRVDAGTVTILFSDIEASTERVSRIGDAAWVEVLELHNQLFRDELVRAGGREIQSMGDGFMLTFPSVRRALGFAVAVQTRLAAYEAEDPEKAVRVRIGIHTGEVITDGAGDLFGRHVHKAARVANLASGGQVLVSATVREIASGNRDFEIGEGSGVELKGLDGTHVVHEVHWQA